MTIKTFPGAQRLLVALAAAAAIAVPSAHAATQLFYGIDNPAPTTGPWPNAFAARSAFDAALTGRTAGTENFESATVGSFQASSLPLTFAGTAVTATMSGAATAAARVVSGASPMVGYPISGSRFVQLTGLGSTSVDVLLTTIVFSQPIIAFGFFGNGISDYCCGTAGPSTQIRIDGGTPFNVINVNTGTVQGTAMNFFGVISDTPFSRVDLILPRGSANDGAAYDDFRVAVAVPEPTTSALLLLGLATLPVVVARRRRSR